MDEIQVCGVYADGVVRIYGRVPKGNGPRPFIKELVFSSYGKAVNFAAEYEEKERQALDDEKKRQALKKK